MFYWHTGRFHVNSQKRMGWLSFSVILGLSLFILGYWKLFGIGIGLDGKHFFMTMNGVTASQDEFMTIVYALI